MRLFDSHCHLADEAFEADLDAVVARGRDAGLAGALVIISADEAAEMTRAETVRAAWPDIKFAAAIHPHRTAPYATDPARAAATTEGAVDRLAALAVGEIGLDYHYDLAPRSAQQAVFAAQVDVAVRRDLPVIIHTRNAFDDTAAILRHAGPGVRGVMHCFTGTREEANLALDLGFHLSFSGILTFPRAAELRALAADVPLDRVLIETDAPYLAPVPYRGRRNEPGWVLETARVLAAARQMALPDLLDALASNVGDLFRIAVPRVDTSANLWSDSGRF